jgi:phospholipase/carboxylesterase
MPARTCRGALLGALAILLGTGACSTHGPDQQSGGSPALSTVTSTAPGTVTSAGTSTASSSGSGPECGRPITGPHRYLSGSVSTHTDVLLLGSGPRGVVVGAQANGGICQTLAYAQTLTARGYHLALFDWMADYAADLTTAARALLADGAEKIVVGGFSRGALVGLGVAPSLGPAVVGVLSVSGGPSLTEGFPTIASLARFAGPILLVSSTDDPTFPHGTSARIASAHTAGPNTLLIVPGSQHALALLNGSQGTRITGAIDAFLHRVLGG